MGRLIELYEKQGQSPWLDNIKRSWITDGDLRRWVRRGVRGLTSNPTIFQQAITSGGSYNAQLARLTAEGSGPEECYWSLVTEDIRAALEILMPVHESSSGVDGFVSVEVDPSVARDTQATIEAARRLHTELSAPNLYIKIPATLEGLPAVTQMISEGCSVNCTLLFSLERYEQVIDAYIAGLEALEGDLSTVSSVASFFVSRVDTECDRRLQEIGTPEALSLRGRVAVANAQLAYQLFCEKFSGPRWEALAARGARAQRPLWASTSTKDPSYPDTCYVDPLIGPQTVNTMPPSTLDAFDDHGVVARTVDRDPGEARAVLEALAELGISLTEVTSLLEEEGVEKFAASHREVLAALEAKAGALTR